MKFLNPCILSFILFLLPISVEAQIHKTLKKTFYTIKAKSLKEIPDLLIKKTPIPKKFLGSTEYVIRISTQSKKSQNGCQIIDSEIFLDTHITLPKLEKSSALSKEDWKLWDKFLKALSDHENEHAKIGEHKARRAKMIMGSINVKDRFFESCEDISGFLNQLIKLLIAESYEDKLYDFLTNHGQSEGAHLDDFR